METFLITGGAGFIGSHLAEHLLEQGHKVYSIDNLSTGRIKNIEHLREKYPERFVHHTASIEGKEHLVAELIDLSDVVFHLAAAVGVDLVVKYPIRTLETNLDCTEIILRHSSKKNKKVIVTSTSEVYGKGGDSISLKEDADLLLGSSEKSRWCYATSKLCDEHLALAYFREKKLPVIVVRLFNTVGPKQVGHYGMVVPRFIKSALQDQPITVFGDGNQSRCFCYVKDTVRALILISQDDRAVGQIYNIGNEKEISINDLAKLVKSRLKSNSEIAHIPFDKAYDKGFEDMKRRFPNTNKIRELTGWHAEVPLEKVIDLTADWIKTNEL